MHMHTADHEVEGVFLFDTSSRDMGTMYCSTPYCSIRVLEYQIYSEAHVQIPSSTW